MAISNVVDSLINQSFGAQSAPQPAPDPAVKKALKQAETRVEQQASSTQVKLSAYGQIKGAFAEAQAAGKAAAEVKKTARPEDVKKAAAKFVEAFNRAHKAASSAVSGEANKPGALAGETRARQAGNDLQRSLQGGNTLNDLKNVGITQNKDGSLKIDEKAFEKALQANPQQTLTAVANAGQQVEKTAARELADTGNVGASVNRLGSRARELETQRTALQEQAAAQQRLVEQRTAITNNNVAGSLAAYQRTFAG